VYSADLEPKHLNLRSKAEQKEPFW